MARMPAVELAREWISRAEDGDAPAMAELLSDDARFSADLIRGRRFVGREAVERYFVESGLEAQGYAYTAVDYEYAVVTVSLRRKLPNEGFADSTLAMVFKAEGNEIVCLDAFPSAAAAFASLANNGAA